MNQKLTPFSLLRDIYQVLLTRGRTYAAFTNRDKEILEREFCESEEVLDPMSGYGKITRYCSQLGMSSFTVEYNRPQYYWQILNHPKNSKLFIDVISDLLLNSKKFPKSKMRAISSDEWFPEESKILLFGLLKQIDHFIKLNLKNDEESKNLSLALLMPFVGRLACCVAGDNVTHVKKGGLCIYRNWQNDLIDYFTVLQNFLRVNLQTVKCSSHKINQGDARTFHFPKRKFTALYSSPPYPNHRDFSSMFKPENAFLNILEGKEEKVSNNIIGSNFIRGKNIESPKSMIAIEFLKKIKELSNRKKFQVSHDDVYYLPYLRNYFVDLEKAYENVETGLADKFKGFIVVVNNTHRGLIIPVAEVIMEIWKNFGYSAQIFESKEMSHLGAKNPRAKGIRAKHTEYVIKIWK